MVYFDAAGPRTFYIHVTTDAGREQGLSEAIFPTPLASQDAGRRTQSANQRQDPERKPEVATRKCAPSKAVPLPHTGACRQAPR
eukprot:6566937-Prymnesium_polylepis.1